MYQIDNLKQEDSESLAPSALPFALSARWVQVVFWISVGLLVVLAVALRFPRLNVPSDLDGYDEGVYWQSLRSLANGFALYHTTFYSQPPVFLLSVFPTYVLAGHSIWSARLGITLVSLLAFPGVCLLGYALAGRPGVLIGLLLLAANTLYLSESQILQAEAPSTAFSLLAIGFALLWWMQPEGRRGACWAALAGITCSLSLLSKLLGVTTLVPLGILLLARGWQIWRGYPGTSRRSWYPLLAGVGGAVLTLLIFVLPFLGSFTAAWSSVVTFHEAAARSFPLNLNANLRLLNPDLFSLAGICALYGVLMAVLRRDWRILPLLLWLGVTYVVLLHQSPLLAHHKVALEPPLIALAISGVALPTHWKFSLPRVSARYLALVLPALGILLILFLSVGQLRQDYRMDRSALVSSSDGLSPLKQQVIADLQHAVTPQQWVVTDGQFIVAQADRNTPPQLVDTSAVRIGSNYLTSAQLVQITANPQVHAVLFFSYRFASPTMAPFVAWVKSHFHLLHTYGPDESLWVR